VYIQACHEAKTRQMDLIIVTNDEKDDWWWRRGPDMIGPRQEMTKEFFDKQRASTVPDARQRPS
jgi:hypothetical protein